MGNQKKGMNFRLLIPITFLFEIQKGCEFTLFENDTREVKQISTLTISAYDILVEQLDS